MPSKVAPTLQILPVLQRLSSNPTYLGSLPPPSQLSEFLHFYAKPFKPLLTIFHVYIILAFLLFIMPLRAGTLSYTNPSIDSP